MSLMLIAAMNIGSNGPVPIELQYLVIGGGGTGWSSSQYTGGGGGGGAGGYRSSVLGEFSGGFFPAEPTLIYNGGEILTLTVGAGGSQSTFGPITALAGGNGGGANSNGSNGGSGGGGGQGTSTGGLGTLGQGKNGAFYSGYHPYGLGGGGAGYGGTEIYYNGGDGIASSITGVSTIRAGGGGAGRSNSTPFAGGSGGGGAGGTSAGVLAIPGTTNTGGGGGGGSQWTMGGIGGSGVVIIRYPESAKDLTAISPGLAYNQYVAAGYKVYEFTAGTGTITV